MIFSVRHGEREDGVGKGMLAHAMGIDPKLTLKGITQALTTGKYIAKLLSEHTKQIDKVYIYSSPFMRCLTTAQGVKKGIEQEMKEANVSKIRLTMGLFEELSCFKPSDKPHESLQIFNVSEYPRVKQILNLDEFDLQTFKQQFGCPEFEGSFETFVDKRFIHAYNGILELHYSEIEAARSENKEVVMICVTHFTGVNIFDMETKAMSEADSYIPAPYYCCVSQGVLSKEEGKRILIRKRCSDKSHLSELL